MYLSGNEVWYNSSEPFSAISFYLVGATVEDTYGGVIGEFAGSNGLYVFAAFQDVPSGCGILMLLDLNGDPVGLTSLEVYDESLRTLDFTMYQGLLDCNGEWDGGAVLDQCGVCDGDGYGSSCSPPELFIVNQSILQAFYYFEEVSINGEPIGPDDWVGAFNGDKCIGSRQGDISQCTGSNCVLPVMGDDGSALTEGYIQSGISPQYKIYKASTNLYYDVYALGNDVWYPNAINYILGLDATMPELGCIDETACNDLEPGIECGADDTPDCPTVDDGSCVYPLNPEVNDNCFEYSLPDFNPNSETYGQSLSLGSFEDQVTLYYFGHQY